MRTIHRDIVSALIFSKDGKLFQGMKDPAKGGVYADCWHIPGGGVEAGEDKIQALKREVREETGIDIAPYPIEFEDNQGRGQAEKTLRDTGERVMVDMVFNVYRVTIGDKNAAEINVQLNDDLVQYHWVDLADLKNYKLTPPSTEYFEKIGWI